MTKPFLHLLKETVKTFPNPETFTIPPPIVDTLKMEYLDYEPGISLKARFPYLREFANPAGVYLGGMLAAAIDTVFGPFTYLESRQPCASLSQSTNFIRPFLPADKWAIATVKSIQKTKNYYFLEATVVTEGGKIIAQAITQMVLFKI